uniref:Uncharacterized protein n=1 Tax=Rhizophora mucronata TaxID=61149 RepID=A0A2P2KFB2_RHIMU
MGTELNHYIYDFMMDHHGISCFSLNVFCSATLLWLAKCRPISTLCVLPLLGIEIFVSWFSLSHRQQGRLHYIESAQTKMS